MSAEEFFFQSEPRAHSTKRRVRDIKVLKENLGQDVCRNIFFIDSILGCDTSRLHSIGKGTSLKKFCVSRHFRSQAKVFNNISASKREVIEADEKVFVCLYNGKSGETLDCLRYRQYGQKVPTLKTLPKFSHRTYDLLRPQQPITVFKCILSGATTEGS